MIKTHRHPSLSSPPSPREVSRPCPSCSASASSSSSRAGFETTPDHHHEGDDHDDHGTSYITWLTINNTQNMKPIMKQQLHKDSYITCTTLTDNPVSLARASRTCKLYQICLENIKCWKWITWKLSAYFGTKKIASAKNTFLHGLGLISKLALNCLLWAAVRIVRGRFGPLVVIFSSFSLSSES